MNTDVIINGTLILQLYEKCNGVLYFLHDTIALVTHSGIIEWEELLDSPIRDYQSAARKIALDREAVEVLHACFICNTEKTTFNTRNSVKTAPYLAID